MNNIKCTLARLLNNLVTTQQAMKGKGKEVVFATSNSSVTKKSKAM